MTEGTAIMRSLEGQGLVGGEESHELRHLVNANLTGLVHVEVSPGSWEVLGEVGGLLGSLESLVGLEDLSGGGSGGGLVHLEVSVRGSVLVLSLKGVLLDHGSHEDVVGSSGEVVWDLSLVLLVKRSGSILSGLEELTRVIFFFLIVSELDIGVRVRRAAGAGGAGLSEVLDGADFLNGGKTEESNKGNAESHYKCSVKIIIIRHLFS